MAVLDKIFRFFTERLKLRFIDNAKTCSRDLNSTYKLLKDQEYSKYNVKTAQKCRSALIIDHYALMGH